MIPTTQLYVFEVQDDLDRAVSALTMFNADLYDVLSTADLALHIWFADLETVCIPWCAIVFPEPTE